MTCDKRAIPDSVRAFQNFRCCGFTGFLHVYSVVFSQF